MRQPADREPSGSRPFRDPQGSIALERRAPVGRAGSASPPAALPVPRRSRPSFPVGRGRPGNLRPPAPQALPPQAPRARRARAGSPARASRSPRPDGGGSSTPGSSARPRAEGLPLREPAPARLPHRRCRANSSVISGSPSSRRRTTCQLLPAEKWLCPSRRPAGCRRAAPGRRPGRRTRSPPGWCRISRAPPRSAG